MRKFTASAESWLTMVDKFSLLYLDGCFACLMTDGTKYDIHFFQAAPLCFRQKTREARKKNQKCVTPINLHGEYRHSTNVYSCRHKEKIVAKISNKGGRKLRHAEVCQECVGSKIFPR